MRETNSQPRHMFAICVTGAVLLALWPAFASHAAEAQGKHHKPAEHSVRVVETRRDYVFRYSYPAKAAADPAVRARLQADRDASRTELITLSRDARAAKARGEDDMDVLPFRVSTEWVIEANSPGWLSLSATTPAYIGGAHGNLSYQYLLWDKQARRDRPTLSLFTSPEALETAVQPALCDALDVERSIRRDGAKIVRDPKDWANACVAMHETLPVLSITKAGGHAFNQIRFLIAPYIAGPYSDGPYEIAVPVTPAILATVRPEFRSAFVVGR